MRLYLDTEFDGFGGPLVSMALVGSGHEFYEEIFVDLKDEWVQKNVAPLLCKTPIPYKAFQIKLHQFLNKFDSCEIVADWPRDIQLFCESLITGKGLALNTPPLVFVLARGVTATSLVPHYALEDARALEKVFLTNP